MNRTGPPRCDLGRRCGGVFAADEGGRGRHARTPQSAAPRAPRSEIAAHRGRIVKTTGMASTSLFAPDRERTNPDPRIFEHRNRPALQRRNQSRKIGHQQRRLLLGISAALLSEDDN